MNVRKGKVLPRSFYQRPALEVSRDLIGKALCRKLPGGRVVRHLLTEVEAYTGPEDKACHASKGKTPRTAVMFEPGGVCYVYLCYGIHWMLNLVTDGGGHPAAILIRGVGDIRGPGRVTKQLAIDKALNTERIHPASGLWVEDAGVTVADDAIARTPRIGIGYAGDYWIGQPYRFVVTDAWWRRYQENGS